MEKTLIIIKPDAANIANKIFSELDKIGKRIKTVKIPKVKEPDILEHYEDAIRRHGNHLINKIKKFFINKTIILALYESENIINKMREKIGDINPTKALPNTIRGKFCNDNLDIATKQGRFVRNAVHASASKQEFEQEFKVWKEYFE